MDEDCHSTWIDSGDHVSPVDPQSAAVNVDDTSACAYGEHSFAPPLRLPHQSGSGAASCGHSRVLCLLIQPVWAGSISGADIKKPIASGLTA